MDNILNFTLDNLEIIVASLSGVGAVYIFLKRKPRKISNDLTPYIIKYKRQQDRINKSAKSVF